MGHRHSPLQGRSLAPVRGTAVIFGNALPLFVLVLFGLRFLLKQLGHHLEKLAIPAAAAGNVCSLDIYIYIVRIYIYTVYIYILSLYAYISTPEIAASGWQGIWKLFGTVLMFLFRSTSPVLKREPLPTEATSRRLVGRSSAQRSGPTGRP